MTNQELIENLRNEFVAIEKLANSFTEEQFFHNPSPGKWSVAENTEHLFLSVKPLAGLFGNPQIMLEKWGRVAHPLRNYDKVVADYLSKAGNIAIATTIVIPQDVELTKGEQLVKFSVVNEKLVERVSALPDEVLDTYQVPHPLLGLLSVREFVYFTIYHTKHHGVAIAKLKA